MFKEREPIGWEGLSERYRKSLLSFFLKKTGSYSDSEDLVHEVFLKILDQGPDRLKDKDSYVFTVALNTLRDRWRRDKVRANYLETGSVEIEQIDQLTPERVALSRCEIDQTMAAIGEMGQRTREMFILFRFEEMSQRDIAAKFGVSASAVEKNIARALLHLKRLRN